MQWFSPLFNKLFFGPMTNVSSWLQDRTTFSVSNHILSQFETLKVYSCEDSLSTEKFSSSFLVVIWVVFKFHLLLKWYIKMNSLSQSNWHSSFHASRFFADVDSDTWIVRDCLFWKGSSRHIFILATHDSFNCRSLCRSMAYLMYTVRRIRTSAL